MCELFGMAARRPATVNLSLAELARHGGQSAHHRDGWGVAWYRGPTAQVLRGVEPASDSELMRFLVSDELESHIVIGHIRKATQGAVTLHNTQPFVRTLAGRDHVFAHNGDLKGLARQPVEFRPQGDTDSERAFCLLMDRMAELWDRDASPDLGARQAVFQSFAHEMGRHGPANFLYSDGEALFAHSHQRTQRSGVIAAPGMHVIERACHQPSAYALTGVVLSSQDIDQHVQLVASVPLSTEAWRPLPQGAVLALQG